MNDKEKPPIVLWAYAISLFVFVFAVFSPVRDFQFLNFDDDVYVTENPQVKGGLSLSGLRWAFTTTHGGHWHPLSWVSHQIDVSLFGLDPAGPHLVNAFIHALNALCLFWLLYALFGAGPWAWLAAALFALHPLRIESVAWVTERKDVLSLFFGLLSLLMYARYRLKAGIGAFGASVLFLAFGLLAKPSLVVLPVLLLLLDFWPFGVLRGFSAGLGLRRILAEKAPFAVLALSSGLITVWSQAGEGALPGLQELAWNDRLASGFVGYLGYLGLSAWPSGLGVFYPAQSYPPGVGVGAFLAFVLMTLTCWKHIKGHPYYFFMWAWFVVSLLPVIGFLQVGGQALANRWAYWPHVGLAIGLCGLASRTAAPNNRRLAAGSAAVLAFFLVQTVSQLPHWKDSQSLFTRTLQVTRGNFLAHTNLGAALAGLGKISAAWYHYEEAVRINPGYAEALNNLGGLKAANGDLEGAFVLFDRALTRNPGDAVTRYNRALALYQKGEKSAAFSEWLSLASGKPGYGPARASLEYAARHDSGEICRQASKGNAEDLRRLVAAIMRWGPQSGDLEGAFEGLAKCLREAADVRGP